MTLTVQEPPAAIELPQVLVWLNGPLTLTEETETALLPGLDTVTVCAPLVEPDGNAAERQARRRRRQGGAAGAAAGEDLELGELGRAPAGVAGEAELHVPGGGPGRQADRDRVAGRRG